MNIQNNAENETEIKFNSVRNKHRENNVINPGLRINKL